MVVSSWFWCLPAGGGRGAHAVAFGDVADGSGEEAGVLAGGQVTAGKGQDLGLGHALAGGLDLPVRGGVPAPRVAAVLADESRGVVEERRPVPAGDRRPQLGELGRGGMVAAGVQ